MSQPAALEGRLFLGTHGHVAAVDVGDGELLWKTSLPDTGYESVMLLVEDGRLFAGTRGKLFALDPADGSILWTNKLPGLGLGIVTLATATQAGDARVLAVAAAAAQQQAVQSATITTST